MFSWKKFIIVSLGTLMLVMSGCGKPVMPMSASAYDGSSSAVGGLSGLPFTASANSQSGTLFPTGVGSSGTTTTPFTQSNPGLNGMSPADIFRMYSQSQNDIQMLVVPGIYRVGFKVNMQLLGATAVPYQVSLPTPYAQLATSISGCFMGLSGYVPPSGSVDLCVNFPQAVQSPITIRVQVGSIQGNIQVLVLPSIPGMGGATSNPAGYKLVIAGTTGVGVIPPAQRNLTVIRNLFNKDSKDVSTPSQFQVQLQSSTGQLQTLGPVNLSLDPPTAGTVQAGPNGLPLVTINRGGLVKVIAQGQDMAGNFNVSLDVNVPQVLRVQMSETDSNQSVGRRFAGIECVNRAATNFTIMVGNGTGNSTPFTIPANSQAKLGGIPNVKVSGDYFGVLAIDMNGANGGPIPRVGDLSCSGVITNDNGDREFQRVIIY